MLEFHSLQSQSGSSMFWCLSRVKKMTKRRKSRGGQKPELIKYKGYECIFSGDYQVTNLLETMFEFQCSLKITYPGLKELLAQFTFIVSHAKYIMCALLYNFKCVTQASVLFFQRICSATAVFNLLDLQNLFCNASEARWHHIVL